MPSSTDLGARPFDGVAREYDADFTDRPLGRWLRQHVWTAIQKTFQPGGRLLELGCGTGEDAVHLAGRGFEVVATDASNEMLRVASAKAHAAGLESRLTVAPLDITAPTPRPELDGPFDGVFSNFGALNCAPSWQALGQFLDPRLRPGARVALVVMGPLCPWETAFYLLRGRPRTALRRLRRRVPTTIGGRPLDVSYPSPRRLARALGPSFQTRRVLGIGVLLPPSYVASTVERWPRLFSRLNRWESSLASTVLGRTFNDHYLLELEKRG